MSTIFWEGKDSCLLNDVDALQTGKTYTLVEIIRQLVFVQKKRVLVCGASNLAVGEAEPRNSDGPY